MSSYLPLLDGESLIPVTHELLWRQITPSLWVSDCGIPSSHAFGPATADNGKPSYSRESLVTATEAMAWHNENARSPSLGVWAVAVNEVDECGTRAVDDHLLSRSNSPGHCYVDYQHMNKTAEREVRPQLLLNALKRGAIIVSAADLAGEDEIAG